jgi:hypothetical protein
MPVKVFNTVWVKLGLLIAVPFFAIAGSYSIWVAVEDGLNSLLKNLIPFGAGLFCLSILPTGLTLLRFLNHEALLEEDGIEVRKGNTGIFLRWNEIGKMHFQPTMQVFKLYNQSGHLVYAVDYYAKNFRQFAAQLCELLSNEP